jgi:zinc and cadmium transporter
MIWAIGSSADAGTWGLTLLSLFIVSSISLVGAATLVLASDLLSRMMVVLIPFAAGALLGDAFIHALPEVARSKNGFDLTASLSVLAGILAFFILEKILHWHHSHIPHEDVMHPVAVSNLVGDGLHNFVDGAIIAAAFLVSTGVGVATTIAVALHELPQELGDFAILVHGGLKPRTALKLNFLSALTAVLGGVITLLFSTTATSAQALVPFSAGAFVYIASTDLIPELHKEPEPSKSFLQAIALVAGIAVMTALLPLE